MKPRPRMTAARPTTRLTALALALASLAGLGCYRATGQQREDITALRIPATGGDRPAGLKAAAAPGDYYIGNDYVEVAVDGTPFGDGGAVGGAASGGSLIDAGKIGLDTSYRRYSLPTDMLERLTPVVNQDPRIPLVFDTFLPGSAAKSASLEMTGRVYDPENLLASAPHDADGCIQGLKATHRLSLGSSDAFLLLETTLANTGSQPLPIRNIADALHQSGGGFRFNIPALSGGWGVEIPQSDWSQPLASGTQASMVALMGAEPSGVAEDAHGSLGLLPMDADRFVVTSDAQHALTDIRPAAPERLAVGSLPATGDLAPGSSLSYTRRLYIVGGISSATTTPAEATVLFNLMTYALAERQDVARGTLSYSLVGSAVRQGAAPTEVQIERQVDAATNTWQVQRVDWLEPNNQTTDASGSSSLAVLLPVGTYRMTLRNRFKSPSPFTLFVDSNNEDRPDLKSPLVIAEDEIFASSSAMDYLCPEREDVISPGGTAMDVLYTAHSFSTRAQDNGDVAVFQPARVTVAGQGSTPDPENKRTLTLGGYADALTREKAISSSAYGTYYVRGGNQVFGTAMPSLTPAILWLPKGEYVAYASRGPLSDLDRDLITAYLGQTSNSHAFTFFKASLPTGWTSFDMPGPSQVTTGGMLPYEQLSSALAEGVQVVARTEVDRLMDAATLRDAFRMDFTLDGLDDDVRDVVGEDPYVVQARSSVLASDGTVTALFVPAPRNERNGGARSSETWNLADFLGQAEGGYTVVHRPRGPKGLFTLRSGQTDLSQPAIAPGVALGSGANGWWSLGGPLANGQTLGQFDAIELLRGEGCNAADPSAWFTEFKALRTDWLTLLSLQTPSAFTKALGLSSGVYSLDTPVGLARTYLKATGFTQKDQTALLNALKSGAAVASTGPMLDVTVNGAGPGSLVAGPVSSATLALTVYAPSWVPVDEVRVVVNGVVTATIPFDATHFTRDSADLRKWTLNAAYAGITLPAKDAFVVVEAGVPLAASGAYRAGTPWNKIMKGIYPIAVANPVFVDVDGGGYKAPGL